MTGSKRWLRLALPAGLLAAWLVASFAQQQAPPPPPADNAEAEESDAPPADDEEREVEDVFIPTEELQPDAAVTFPVDI
jgi:hypothetical protein